VATINPFVIPTIITMVSFILLVSYVLFWTRSNEARNLAIAIMFTLICWAVGEAIMRITTDEGIALVADRILVTIGATFIGALTLHFVLVLTDRLKGIRDSSFYVGYYFIPSFISVLRAGTNAVVVGIDLKYWGYDEVQSGLGSFLYNVLMLLYFIFVLFFLFTTLRKSEGKTKRAYWLLIVGQIIPLVIVFATDAILPLLGTNLPDMAMTATLFFAIMLTIAIRYLEAFEIVPVKEKGRDAREGKPKRSPFIVPTGKIYYIDEHKPDASLRAFASLVYSGRRGLALVRMNPRKFRELTGLETTPVIWLSSQEGPGERAINPSAIPRLFTTINEFLTSAKDPVILIEGIETMIFTNNFREVMGFLSQMYERISVAEDIMIIPISKATVNESEWALMTKHMDDLTPFLPDLTTNRRPEIKG